MHNLLRGSLPNTVLILIAFAVSVAPALAAAAPPVRIAVVTGGGSGIEQSICDRISGRLEMNPNVALSTVNPDWYVVCNIKEMMSQMSGQIRYNGNVLVKTTGGTVIASIAVQKYNQDFSLSPGTPLNKALVDRAARDVIAAAADRATVRIERAVDTEMDTRVKIIKAQIAADAEKYDEAINSMRLVSADSPHFKNARALMKEFAMEKAAMEALKKAQAQATAGKYATAIATLKEIPAKSKYAKQAKQLKATYSARVRKRRSKRLVKSKKTTRKKASTSKDADLKALDKVLKIEKKAIEDAHAKVRKQLKSK